MNRVNSNSPIDKPDEEAGSRSFVGQMLTHLRISIVATIALGVIVSGIYPAIVWGLAQALFHHQANGSLVKKDGTPTDDDAQAVGSAMLGQCFTAPGYFHPRPSAANNSAGSSYSSTGGYDPTSSGGTNYGPLSDELMNGLNSPAPTPPATKPAESLQYDGIRLRTIHYALANGISFKLYTVNPDGSRVEVPLSKYVDAQCNVNDIALVDAFPHGDPTGKCYLIAADFSRPIPADAVTASASGLDPHIAPGNADIQKARVAGTRGISAEQVQQLINEHTDKPDLGFLGDPGVNVLMLNVALDAKYPIPAAVSPATQPAALK